MSLTTDELRHYFANHNPWLWEWKEQGDVVTWGDGSTIAFRPEIAAILQRLETSGLPRFGAIVLLLGACRDTWTLSQLQPTRIMAFAQRSKVSSATKLVKDVFAGLQRVHEMRLLCNSITAKSELAAMVFETAANRLPPDASFEMREAFENGLPAAALSNAHHELELESAILRDFSQLREGLARVDHDSLSLRLRTGLEQPIEAAVVELPSGQAVRELLRQLENETEMGGVARLAKLLLAAVQLPKPLSSADDLPIGGVADISNRGPLDRLLLSELAHDDLTLAVRVAMNEALYLRREPLTKPQSRQRLVVIDSGLRLWGVPRVFATAVGLAVAAQADKQMCVQAFQTCGDELQPIDFGSATGLTKHMEHLDHRVHPGLALARLTTFAAASEIPTDVLLVTHEDVWADHEFQQALANAEIRSLHVATVNRDGRFQLVERSFRGSKVLRSATFQLEDVLAPRKTPAAPLLDKSVPHDLPAIFGAKPYPLRLSTTVTIANSWFVTGLGAITITNDGRLMCWDRAGFGAREIATGLPAGKLHWAPSVRNDDSLLIIFGKLSTQGLYALHIDLRDERSRLVKLQLRSEHPVQVFVQNGWAMVISNQQVEALDPTSGRSLALKEMALGVSFWGPIFANPGRKNSSRNFASVPNNWVKLAFDSTRFEITNLSERWGLASSIIGVVEPGSNSVGPIAILGNGSLITIAPARLRGVTYPAGVGAFQFLAASRDGQRVVLKSSDQRQFLLDVPTGIAEAVRGDPTTLVEGPLFRHARIKPHRTRFVGIGLNRARQLTLVSPKDNCTPIVLDDQRTQITFGRQEVRRSEVLNVVRFEPVSVEPIQGSHLAVATFLDGSRAFLDSAGLLHLKSANAAIPECSIILNNGDTAGWTSAGQFWGSDYHRGESSVATSAADIFRNVIQAFVDQLP